MNYVMKVKFFLIVFFLFLSACGVNEDVDVDELSILSIADASIVEGDTGEKNLIVTLILNEFKGSASVDYSTIDGTAMASDNDYVARKGIVNFLGGNTIETISITINGDKFIEDYETFKLSFSNPNNLKLNNSSALATIINDDLKGPLNDTGIILSGNFNTGNAITCKNDTLKQDCHYGRDITNNDDSDGHAGFSYTKLDENGVALINQSLAWGDSYWSCVKDNVTGLVWEVKNSFGVADEVNNIHHKDNLYRWGGVTALGIDHPENEGDYYSDWDSLVTGSNNAKFCGFTDWRVPSLHELHSIVRLIPLSPAIDIDYFPNTNPIFSSTWTSVPYAGNSTHAWNISFLDGSTHRTTRSNLAAVRLVRF